MVFVQGIFAAFARFAGRILNTAFGWAIQMLYGRVSAKNQMVLNGMAFGAVLWLMLLIGVIYPPFGVWLLTFVRLPRWVQMEWVRLGMLIGAAALPLVVGFLASRLGPAEAATRMEQKPSGWKFVTQGYRLTAGIATTLLMLTLIAPIIKIRAILKRWTSQEVPIIIETQDYSNTVDLLYRTLVAAGWKLARTKANWMLTLPMRVLGFFSQREQPNYVADNLTVFTNEKLEIIVHPSYLSISGAEKEIAPVRGLLVERLTFSPVHLTWDKEAMEQEDKLETVWKEMEHAPHEEILTTGMKRLEAIDADIRRLNIPLEEWEVLYRVKLWVECAMLRTASGQAPLTHKSELAENAATSEQSEQEHSLAHGDMLAHAGGFAVIAVFLGTLWAHRPRR